MRLREGHLDRLPTQIEYNLCSLLNLVRYKTLLKSRLPLYKPAECRAIRHYCRQLVRDQLTSHDATQGAFNQFQSSGNFLH